MKLKKLNPTTNGTRHTVKIQKNLLAKNNRLVRSILKKKTKKSGRSSLNGRITVWHKGGAAKKLYRNIESSESTKNAIVVANCYDPNRNAFINLNFELENKKLMDKITLLEYKLENLDVLENDFFKKRIDEKFNEIINLLEKAFFEKIPQEFFVIISEKPLVFSKNNNNKYFIKFYDRQNELKIKKFLLAQELETLFKSIDENNHG